MMSYRLYLRALAAVAGFFVALAAALHRKAFLLERRARGRLAGRAAYGIASLEHDCWDREDREGVEHGSEDNRTA